MSQYTTEFKLKIVEHYLQTNCSKKSLARKFKVSRSDVQKWIIHCSYNDYALGSLIWAPIRRKVRHHLKSTNDSWRVDETYIKVKSQWMYLYRAVDSEGKTIDFYLSQSRDKQVAKRFFKKALAFSYVSKPRVITVDKNPAYPIAISVERRKTYA